MQTRIERNWKRWRKNECIFVSRRRFLETFPSSFFSVFTLRSRRNGPGERVDPIWFRKLIGYVREVTSQSEREVEKRKCGF